MTSRKKPRAPAADPSSNPWGRRESKAAATRTGKKPRADKAKPAARKPESGRPAAASAPLRREVKYYGVAACLALWKSRPHDVIRIYLEEPLIPKFTELLRWAAAKRKAYHIVTAEDLERLTESIHHQGVCILARERSPLEFNDLLGLLRDAEGPQLLAYLDGVENPHNLGAIVRSCAHFGIRFILGAETRLPKLSASACRVAEGGAEQVALVLLRHPLRQLRQLVDLGYQPVATAGGRGSSLYQHKFSPHTLLIMGAEQQGVSANLFEVASKTLRIPGTGSVESLNVSVAFALCAGEFYRQRQSEKA